MESREYRELFSALANTSCMSIVQALRNRKATVSELAETLAFEQSRVSHSLARLQRVGAVSCRWENKRKLFTLIESVQPLLQQAEAFLEYHARNKPAHAAAAGISAGQWSTWAVK